MPVLRVFRVMGIFQVMSISVKNKISIPLLAGDFLVLLLFVFVGQRDHEMNIVGSLPSLFTTTLAVALPWAVAAWLMGVLRLPEPGERWAWLARVAATWLIAAPLGLLLRATLRDQATIMVVFMKVLLSLGGLTVLVWRAAVAWWVERRRAAVARQA